MTSSVRAVAHPPTPVLGVSDRPHPVPLDLEAPALVVVRRLGLRLASIGSRRPGNVSFGAWVTTRLNRCVLFELDQVSYSRAGREVLNGLTARLPVGSSCLFGPSGSGKSTTLRLLDRLIDPDSGVVRYEGADVRERDVLGLRREVRWCRSCRRWSRAASPTTWPTGRGSRATASTRRRHSSWPGWTRASPPRPAAQLSVGEQQRVMLARALALEPRVLLLDEPTAALDAKSTAAVEPTLEELRGRTSISIVLVTHSEEQARRLAEWVVRIDDGRVVREGPVDQAIAEPEETP